MRLLYSLWLLLCNIIFFQRCCVTFIHMHKRDNMSGQSWSCCSCSQDLSPRLDLCVQLWCLCLPSWPPVNCFPPVWSLCLFVSESGMESRSVLIATLHPELMTACGIFRGGLGVWWPKGIWLAGLSGLMSCELISLQINKISLFPLHPCQVLGLEKQQRWSVCVCLCGVFTICMCVVVCDLCVLFCSVSACLHLWSSCPLSVQRAWIWVDVLCAFPLDVNKSR